MLRRSLIFLFRPIAIFELIIFNPQTFIIVPTWMRLSHLEEASLASILHKLAFLGSVIQLLHKFAQRMINGEGVVDGQLVS